MRTEWVESLAGGGRGWRLIVIIVVKWIVFSGWKEVCDLLFKELLFGQGLPLALLLLLVLLVMARRVEVEVAAIFRVRVAMI